MKGSDDDGYLGNMNAKFNILDKTMKVWDTVDRTTDMYVLSSKGLFKCGRFST